MTFHLSNSAKRKAIVVSHIKDRNSLNDIIAAGTDGLSEDEIQLQAGSRRQGIPTLCETRWLARGDALSAFLANITQVYDALDEIRSTSTSAQSSNDAQSYMHSMESFKFIYIAVKTQYMLAFIRPLSVSLQSVGCNLVEVFDSAQELISTIQQFRDAAGTHDKLYGRAVTFASKIGVEPSRPRLAGRQRQRANAVPNEAIDVYYKVNIFFPFVDHILTFLKERFPEELRNVMQASLLVPNKLTDLSDEIIESLKVEFESDLPSGTELEQEVLRWKTKWQNASEVPANLNESVNACNPSFFPNISCMLKVFACLASGVSCL